METKVVRESWKSRLGFMIAAVGSAVGLGNIWRFPYITGEHGGAAFIALYLLFLVLIGFPVLVAEISLGREAQSSPYGSFKKMGGGYWGLAGKLAILTGFIVSSFYSVVAGWIAGYFVEAIKGNLSQIATAEQASAHFASLVSKPVWSLGCHFGFMLLSVLILYTGVRNGIERFNKILMPLLIILLVFLVIEGLTLPETGKALGFLFSPDWSVLTPAAIIIALGQSFFTLSLGQGTMITYGSYLSKKESIPTTCLPIALVDTGVSILAGIAVFTTVFAVGMAPTEGPALIFSTLPIAFAKLPLGHLLVVLFFLLVILAAITSEISAMEPLIAYLVDEKKWSRRRSVLFCGIASFCVGVPSCLSNETYQLFTVFGYSFFDMISFLAVNVMIPIGGFAVVVVVAWKWGIARAYKTFGGVDEKSASTMLSKLAFNYFRISLKFVAPILIILIFLNALGII